MAGAAAAAGAQHGAVDEGSTLRRAFAAPAPGEVEHLVGAGRQRQHGPQCRDVEGVPVVDEALVSDDSTTSTPCPSSR